jgi:hypothetical protein
MEDHFTHQYFTRQCFKHSHEQELIVRALCAGALSFGTASFLAALWVFVG